MIDTSREAEEIQSELFDKMTGEERMKIASDMFDTARTLVLASLDKNLSDTEKRKALFLRLYRNDFSTDEKEKILNNF